MTNFLCRQFFDNEEKEPLFLWLGVMFLGVPGHFNMEALGRRGICWMEKERMKSLGDLLEK
jgi:hypothetical protein